MAKSNVAEKSIEVKIPHKGITTFMMAFACFGTILIYLSIDSFVLFVFGLACLAAMAGLYRVHLRAGGKTFSEVFGINGRKKI